MKKFLLSCIGFLIILLLCSAGLWIYARNVKNNAYLLARLDKLELLKHTPSPKVVFVGGSNLAFGIDCSQIEDSIGISCVNMGLHAGQGLRFIMEDVDPFIQSMKKDEGNVIVLMPEFGHFFGETSYGESATLGELFLTTPHTLSLMGRKQKMITFKGLPKQLTGSIMESLVTPPKESRFKYLRSNFDDEGDEISHLMMAYDNARTPIPPLLIIQDDLNTDFCVWFKNKIRDWEEHATVVLFPSTVYKGYIEDNFEKITALENELKKLQIPFMTKIDMFSYPYEKMFKSPEHITKDGVIENSGRIGHLLKDFMEEKSYNEVDTLP